MIGREILLYVPLPFLVPIQEPNESEGQIQEERAPIIIRLIKVTQSVSRPQSSHEGAFGHSFSLRLPRDCLNNQARPNEQVRSVLTGPITFQVPEDCADYIRYHEENQEMSLATRLERWQIERRQRAHSERVDKFYYHEISQKMFRTFTEVSKFIIYGLHARRPPPSISQSHKAYVEEFLEEARRNLLNS